jgi:hypothetical protein
MAGARRSVPGGTEPLSPRRKWRAILISTLLLLPGYWSILIGLVAIASDEENVPSAGPYLAFGLMLVPFVFVALAFLSQHPRAPGAVVRAMVLALLVGIPVSALAQDAVTGLVAGLGAGGIAALRMDLAHNWRARALAVFAASALGFVLARVVPESGLLLTPVLPFTSIGVADHLSEERRQPGGG